MVGYALLIRPAHVGQSFSSAAIAQSVASPSVNVMAEAEGFAILDCPYLPDRQNMGKLSEKVAIVTGASRGIGRGIAAALAREGAILVLNSRNADRLESVAAELRSSGSKVEVLAGDVAQEQVVERLFARTLEHFGRLDLLINNAGAFDGGPLDSFDIVAWDSVLATNLRAPFLCTRSALAIMKRQRSGRIINIGSISSTRVRPNSAAYSASKHGLWGLTQVAALEGREYGVTVCCLNPGNIAVERRQASAAIEDQEPMIAVDDIAEVALLMATLPPNVEMLEATVLPHEQKYVGRG
jgi:NAD(P)-dependent dehydrogenase (short-subunit alcohol dehydrogenase family)